MSMKILNARFCLPLIGGLTIYACAKTASHDPAACPVQAGHAPTDELNAGQGGAARGEPPSDAGQAGAATPAGGAATGGLGGAITGGAGSKPSDAGEGGADAGAQAGGAGGLAGASGALSATMFVPNSMTHQVYRYTITPDDDPVLTGTFPVNLATGVSVSPTGELFVGAYSAAGTISRFLSPLGTPVANGAITGVGIHFPEAFTFVDDELWVPNTAAYSCSSDPEDLVRLGFAADGAATVAGTLQAGLVSANRGILWLPATRDLYVTQCIGVDAIQHYRVALDHTVTVLPPITGNGLNNPHGMVMTDWGELLVVNVSTPSVLRLHVDDQGIATQNGSIVGNGMNWAIDIAMAPWGEIFVASQGNGVISRFKFDSAHVATPNGAFQSSSSTALSGIAWLAIVR